MLMLSACSKRCVVNGCRVRMVHRHDGKKFKSKIRPWYAYQNPRVGRDYKRDKDPDKIPWKTPEMAEPSEENLLVSNDTTGLGGDDFFNDDEQKNNLVSDESGKKSKRKKKKGEEELEVQEPPGDPWDIENVDNSRPEPKPIEPKSTENLDSDKEDENNVSSNKEQNNSEDNKKDKKSKKDKEKDKKPKTIPKEEIVEEEDDDDWGF